MKKQLAIFAMVGVLFSTSLFAQDSTQTAAATDSAQTAVAAEPEAAPAEEAAAEEEASFHEVLKDQFIVSYGGVEMGRLEKGLIWISLFIALGPMLGFFGTVVGMVQAFSDIEAAGDISPNIVAGGMKVALITTVGGLVVGMVLQILYNYLVSKIDSITNNMEDASISLVDILVKHKLINNK
ncbi:MAG: MotA/TolQ/ExbB proton channel family protein [Cytophagia bacterium]|nr:MotA/TolQ/ExbB proton channel family protein [Cytophagia bacterium]